MADAAQPLARTCAVCGTGLLTLHKRPGRPVVYCSRACQAKAYRARRAERAVEQHAQEEAFSAWALAEALARAARRVAAAVDTQRAANPADLSMLTSIATLLAKRAQT